MSLFTVDEALFRFINGSLSNPVFDWLMPWFSGPPPVRMALLLAAIVFAWRGGKRAWICLAALGAALVLGEELVYSPLKNWLARPRPYEALTDVNLLVGHGRAHQSAPSSHVGNCFAAVVIFAFYYRRSLPWLLALAVAVGFARIYVGAHFPGDVLLGALLGAAVGAAVLAVFHHARFSAFEKLGTRQLAEIFIAFVLLANLIFLAARRLQLSDDEAHQWLWAKHLGWSFSSEAPPIAWMQFVSTWLFGENEFAVRFFAPLCAAGAAWLMLRVLSREVNARVAFVTVLIAAATPLLAVHGFLFVPESLAILLWAGALVGAWRAITHDSTAAWVGTGLAIGLGSLTIHVAFAQLGCLLLFVALHRPARAQLRRPGPYVALLISAACVPAVLTWPEWTMNPSLRSFGEFISAELGLLTPIFFVGIAMATFRVWRDKQRTAFSLYLLCMSAPLLVGCALLSLVGRVDPSWLAPAVLPAIALMAVAFDPQRERLRPWLGAGLAFGFGLVILAHDTLLIRRLTGYSLPPKLDPLRRMLGWESAATTIETERQRLANGGNAVFVIGANDALTSLLTFYTPAARNSGMRDPFIYRISSDEPPDQSPFSRGYSDRKGQDALFVAESETPQPAPLRLQQEFETVIDLGMRPIYEHQRGEIRRIQLFGCRRLR